MSVRAAETVDAGTKRVRVVVVTEERQDNGRLALKVRDVAEQ